MRLVVQRVSSASVAVEGRIVSEIGKGLLVLVGAGRGDTPETARRLAGKVARLRIFPDGEGKMNLSVTDVDGEVLAVSQFTLYGDTTRGNRPSFVQAADPEPARRLVEEFAQGLTGLGVAVSEGVFGAMMEVAMVNQGPVTILLDR